MSSLTVARLTLRRISTSTRAATARLRSTRRCISTLYNSNPDIPEIGDKYNVSNSQRKTSTLYASAPGWNEDLATPSEASVKADRSGSTTSSTDDLLVETIEYVQSHYNSPSLN